MVVHKKNDFEAFQSISAFFVEATFHVNPAVSVDAVYNGVYNGVLSDALSSRILMEDMISSQYFHVESLEKFTEHIAAPKAYITSTLQQDAATRFDWTPTFVMSVAQQLYEKGKLTYMRTDSHALSHNLQPYANLAIRLSHCKSKSDHATLLVSQILMKFTELNCYIVRRATLDYLGNFEKPPCQRIVFKFSSSRWGLSLCISERINLQ